jgi:hypothetical protein
MSRKQRHIKVKNYQRAAGDYARAARERQALKQQAQAPADVPPKLDPYRRMLAKLDKDRAAQPEDQQN